MGFALKYRHYERYIKPENFIYIIFIVSFLLGILLSFFFHKNNVQGVLWLEQIIQYVKYGEIQYGDLLLYVLKRRCIIIAIIILLCISGRGKFFLLGGVGLAGGFAGFYITEFVVAKGILGSLLFAVSIFPHYICYAYGYMCLLHWMIKTTEKQKSINQGSQKKISFSNIDTQNLIKKLSPVAVVIIGILLECYVNPFILKLFLKIFM